MFLKHIPNGHLSWDNEIFYVHGNELTYKDMSKTHTEKEGTKRNFLPTCWDLRILKTFLAEIYEYMWDSKNEKKRMRLHSIYRELAS